MIRIGSFIFVVMVLATLSARAGANQQDGGSSDGSCDRVAVGSTAPILSATPRHDDIPSAPLPPAFWPGLAGLLALGGIKAVQRSRGRPLWV